MSAAAPAVAVDGLVMRYADKVAVDELSLTVERDTITAVLGPNGAGKTTTLETCEGYRKPQRGSVRVLGLDPVRDRADLLPGGNQRRRGRVRGLQRRPRQGRGRERLRRN